MPDNRQHRGAHPEDAALFAAAEWPRLHSAVADLCWLLTRGYATPSALKLVGDRHNLNQRQRIAAMRSACSDEARDQRAAGRIEASALSGRPLLIDGYNVLTTVETALSGGVLIIGRDGAMRDMASMHGTWRQVQETATAIDLVAGRLRDIPVGPCHWYLDSPVSNSGRLKSLIQRNARAREFGWTVELVRDPDAILASAADPVATSDSVVLDRCPSWFDLPAAVLADQPNLWLVDLRDAQG